MIVMIVFFTALLVSLGIGFVYFRDLGDVSQMVLKVKRENMVRFIRHEYLFLAIGLGAALIAAVAHLGFGAGPRWLFWLAVVLILLFYAFPWIYVHLGLRNQMNTARYYPIAEAAAYVAPANPVIVIEKNGIARAHPDHHLMRPHLAGNDEGLDGEDVVMTYCAMANLGLGYTPEIEDRRLDLEVLAQHGNNLILRDNGTGEPIQHILGSPDGGGPALKAWPTFRMSFHGFQRAYPNGTVFLNKPSANPILRIFDMAMDIAFASGIVRQHQQAAPLMDNMTRHDDRMPNKTYVWGIDIGDDAVAFTQDFLEENDNIVNTSVGGRNIVLAYHSQYESLGAWYNNSSKPVAEIDIHGMSDVGQLTRVERLKAGLFWHVWAEFFPNTDINRVENPETNETGQ